MDANELKYLSLLAKSFPTVAKAQAEIINLNAILNLPKATEVFATDVHGEYEAFVHLLRNGSGAVRIRIDEALGDSLTDKEKSSLATLIYYPREKMDLILPDIEDKNAWYSRAILLLIRVSKVAAGKYTRSKVRKALPKEYAYIIEELMTESNLSVDKKAYYSSIIDAVIRTGCAETLIEAICMLIKRLSIDHLHLVGDIYDRGPYPHLIMDTLARFHSLDIQWGNHDIVWMGAALGQRGCIAHVVRNCARYGNLSVLEDAYGINILPLAQFALDVYGDDPCVAFGLKGNPDLPPAELDLNIKIQKAMAILQFKVEAQLIDENPSFELQDRKLLDKIDYEKGTVVVDGKEYELIDKVFPTIDPADPFRLTPEEEEVMDRLVQAFVGSEKLQRHMHISSKWVRSTKRPTIACCSMLACRSTKTARSWKLTSTANATRARSSTKCSKGSCALDTTAPTPSCASAEPTSCGGCGSLLGLPCSRRARWPRLSSTSLLRRKRALR